jgi:hypothetical protein
LNSSISAISLRISGVIRIVSIFSAAPGMPENAPDYTHLGKTVLTPIYAQ